MTKIGAAVTAGMILCTSLALGQESLSSELMGEQHYLDLKRDLQGFSAAKWEPVKKDATAEEVKVHLERAGWDTGTVLENLEGGTKFDLYQKAIAPGQIGYMALPKAGKDAEPATFWPTDPSGILLAKAGIAPSSKAYSGSEIKAELLRGIQTGIDTFCGMQTKPSTVTMTVSAFGLVEVEATWNTADVCPVIPGATP